LLLANIHFPFIFGSRPNTFSVFIDIETCWNHARFSTNTFLVAGSKIFINPSTEIAPVSLGRFVAGGVVVVFWAGRIFSVIHYLP